MRGRRLRGALFASLIVLAAPVIVTGTASAHVSDPPVSHCEASTGVVDGTMQLLAAAVPQLVPQALLFTGPSCATGAAGCGDANECAWSVKLTATSLYGRAAARIFLQLQQPDGSWIPWRIAGAPVGDRTCSNGRQNTRGAKCTFSGTVFRWDAPEGPPPSSDFTVRAVCSWQLLDPGEFALQPAITQCILAASLPGS